MSQNINPSAHLENALERSSTIPETNDSVALPLNPAGYELGNILFQGFLVAGERYMNSGRARPDTDEARFEELFKELTPDKQAPMRRYFASQAKLEPKERAKVLGNLADLKPEDPLTLDVTAAKLFESPLYMSYLTPIASFRSTLSKQPAPQLIATPTANPRTSSNRLTLRLEKLTVEEVLDNYRHLYQIEHSFRTFKTHLETRPMFHWTDKRIEGHICLCYIAYTLLIHVQNKLLKGNIKLSESQIRKALDNMQVSFIKNKEDYFYLRSANKENIDVIVNRMGLKKLPNIIAQQEIKNYL